MQDGCSTDGTGHHPWFIPLFFPRLLQPEHLKFIWRRLERAGNSGICTARLAKPLDSISLIPGILGAPQPGAEGLKSLSDVNTASHHGKKTKGNFWHNPE